MVPLLLSRNTETCRQKKRTMASPKSTGTRVTLTKKRLSNLLTSYHTTGDIANALGVASASVSRALRTHGLTVKRKNFRSHREPRPEKTGSKKADLGKAAKEADRVRELIKQDKLNREEQNAASKNHFDTGDSPGERRDH